MYVLLHLVRTLLIQWIPNSVFASLLSVVPRITTITEDDQIIISNFIQWFGILYGLILTAVFAHALEQFSDAEQAFDAELSTISALHNTCHLLSSNVLKVKILKNLKEYINIVKTNPSARDAGENFYNDFSKNIRICVSEIIDDKNDNKLAGRIIDLIDKLLEKRVNRLSCANPYLPSSVKVLSSIASIAWLLPFFVLQFDNPLIGPLIIITVTLAVSSILLITLDLINPIGGTWGIQFDPWKKLEEELENECKVIEVKIESIYKIIE